MKCPVCTSVDLVMAERQGVEIDYCPQCRGVWLDRGELDKIIERSVQQEVVPPPQPAYAQPPQYAPQQPQYAPQPHGYNKDHHSSGYGHGDSHGYKQHRKKSFLEELFD